MVVQAVAPARPQPDAVPIDGPLHGRAAMFLQARLAPARGYNAPEDLRAVTTSQRSPPPSLSGGQPTDHHGVANIEDDADREGGAVGT
jgi:hypothetical protein